MPIPAPITQNPTASGAVLAAAATKVRTAAGGARVSSPGLDRKRRHQVLRIHRVDFSGGRGAAVRPE